MTPLSVLDLSLITEGGDAAQALRNTRDLAQHAERWGYRRYWVAEHHNIPGIASSATSMLIGYVAAGSPTMRRWSLQSSAGPLRRSIRAVSTSGSVSKMDTAIPMPLIYNMLFPSISTFETPPKSQPALGRLPANRGDVFILVRCSNCRAPSVVPATGW
jgi:Luciferase-like monooxygenase